MANALQRLSRKAILLLGAAIGLSSVRAQQPLPVAPVSTTITVIGNPQPVTIGESDRSTTVIDTEQQPFLFSQVEDYLRTDASTFVQQRGAGGSQADISIRGTSFEQTLVLLNGLRINDAETAHNNMDIPVPQMAIRSIDILHGAGSTLYGSDAIGGTVDFVTVEPAISSLLVRAVVGNFGTTEQEATATIAEKKWSVLLAGQRASSEGFMDDRDYRDQELSLETRAQTSLGTTDILLAGDDRAFGANQFYGNYPSYERTKGWFASISQSFGDRIQAAFGYRRHTDQYVLFRDNPAVYENNHIDTSWEGALRGSDGFGRHVKLFYGLEGDCDGIRSNNLGKHARYWGSGYVDAEMHWGKSTISAGIRQEIMSGDYSVSSPILAASYYVTGGIKLRGAIGYGFRLPTYLDLYYSDPSTIGNSNLKPESAWNFEGGADWFASARLFVGSTVFYSRQRDAIDYVRTDASQPWAATNLSGLRFTGWENAIVWQRDQATWLKASWTLLVGAQQALQGLQSRYVFNYPVNNASLEGTHTWRFGFQIHTRIGVTERYQQNPYAVWDLSMSRVVGRLHQYLRLTNITNTGYQEVLNVQMPGRQIVAGMEFAIGRHAS